MPLNATNFITKGPVLHADLLQFFNLFTGVMLDQPVTFKNVLTLGGNQGTSTVPLKIYGAVGQTGHLLDLYADTGQAQPGFGFGAAGNFGWGPGGASPVDTFLSRVATQNGHATDTAGLLIQPYLEVTGPIQATSFQFSNGTALSSTSPLQLTVNQDLVVNRQVLVGSTSPMTITNSQIQLGTGNLLVSGNPDVYLVANAYYGASNWISYTPAQPSAFFYIDRALGLAFATAPAAANPTFTNKLTVDQNGYVIGSAGATFHGDLKADRNGGVSGVINLGSSVNNYIIFDGSNWSCQNGSWFQALDVHAGGNLTAVGGVLSLSDANIARWNPGQLRIYSSSNAGLTVAGPITVESDYTLSFSVNGYGWKGVSGNPVVRTEGSVQAAGGALFLDAALACKFYWDGAYQHHNKTVYTDGDYRANGGSLYLGVNATYFSLLQQWNPGEFRVSSNGNANLYTAGFLTSSGGPCTGNGAYVNSACSERLKHDVLELDNEDCLAKVNDCRIRPVSFEYNDPLMWSHLIGSEPGVDEPVPDWTPDRLGFIAEEVARVVPQAVGMHDGYAEGLIVEGLVPVLWGAVRALSARISELERIAA